MPQVVLAGMLAAVVVAVPVRAADGVPVLVIDGRGHGHGVGMAQDGAFWMAKAGASTEDILAHFYPGTALAGPAGGQVRVPVLTTEGLPAAAEVILPDGGEIRDGLGADQGDGFPVVVEPGASVYLSWDGQRYQVEGGRPTWRSTGVSAAAAEPSSSVTVAASSTTTSSTTTSTSTTSTSTTTTTTTGTGPLVPPPSSSTTTTAAPSPPPPPPREPAPEPVQKPTSGRSLWAVPAGGSTVTVPAREARTYRGAVEATAVGGPLRLVNHVDVETYLKGMAEVLDPAWPPAAHRVQAVAARTYALRAMRIAGEICDTQRCQVYVGAGAEYGAMSAAVDATRGQVLTFDGRLASAVYSSNAGGNSASPEEGFGTDNAFAPYLRAGPYLTHDPRPWTVEIALSDVAGRLGYPGELHGAGVHRFGPSGRALEVVVDGSEGPMIVDGLTFDEALGLKSNFIVGLRTAVAAVAPDAPARSTLQRPPGFRQPADDEVEAAADTATGARVRDRVTAAWPGGRIATVPTRLTPPRRGTDLSGVVFYSVALLALAAVGLTARARRSKP